jgi:hypothetical protein
MKFPVNQPNQSPPTKQFDFHNKLQKKPLYIPCPHLTSGPVGSERISSTSSAHENHNKLNVFNLGMSVLQYGQMLGVFLYGLYLKEYLHAAHLHLTLSVPGILVNCA